MTDRGQSETLGFVLVFGLVVSTVAVASVAGFSGLQAAQDFQRTDNAERAFDILADNVAAVAHEGAPSRSTSLDVRDAELVLAEPVTVGVNVSGVDDPFTMAVRPIVYEGPDGARLAYANGAVVRQDRDGMIMLRRPAVLLSEERAVIQIVQTQSQHRRSLAGRSVIVRTDAAGRELLFADATPHEVTLTVESPRAAAWERHLGSKPGVSCTRTGSAVTCSVTTDAVAVSVTRIAVTAT